MMRGAQRPLCSNGQDLAAIALATLVGSHLLRLGIRTYWRDLPAPTPQLLGYIPLLVSSVFLLWVGISRMPGTLGVPPHWRDALRGLTYYAAFFPIVLGVGWCNEQFFAGSAPRHQSLVFLDAAAPWARISVIVLLTTLVPLSEELIFRGFLLRGLEGMAGAHFGAGRTARWLALGFSAAVFAAVHDTFAMIPVFVVGLILGWITQHTGGLTTACCFHALHNAATVWLSAGGLAK